MHAHAGRFKRTTAAVYLSTMIAALHGLSTTGCIHRDSPSSISPAAYETYIRVQIEIDRAQPNFTWALTQAKALVEAFPQDLAVQELLVRVQQAQRQHSLVRG